MLAVTAGGILLTLGAILAAERRLSAPKQGRCPSILRMLTPEYFKTKTAGAPPCCVHVAFLETVFSSRVPHP